MADVRPFRGIRYNPDRFTQLSPLMSPPYDVIDGALQEKLYRQSPYGIVRIDFGKDEPGDDESENRYTRAAALFDAWRGEGVLIRDETPALYSIEEDYKGEFGRPCTRRGFLASVRVEDAESGVYRPHEKTLAGPKADRLRLTRACRANLSPVFSLYDDPQGAVDAAIDGWKAASSGARPVLEVESLEGTRVRMWKVEAPEVFATVRAAMGPKSFFIADGHHRYETALNYRNLMRAERPGATGEEPWNFVLMYLCNLWSPGLSVLPTHRAIHGLESFDASGFLGNLGEFFEVETVGDGLDGLLARMRESRGRAQTFGLALKGEESLRILTARQDLPFDELLARRAKVLRSLDVTVLHGLVIERLLGIDEKAQEEQKNLRYVKDARELLEIVRRGEAEIGVFLNPTPVEEVKRVAETGERMPQKSTYFYPKIVTGAVIHPLWEGD